MELDIVSIYGLFMCHEQVHLLAEVKLYLCRPGSKILDSLR